MEPDVSYILARLDAVASSCEYNIRRTQENLIQKEALDKSLKEENQAVVVCMTTNDSLAQLEKALIQFNANKQEKAMTAIYSAIYSARSIIPDSSPVQLKISRESAYLVTDDDDEVNLVEGSAFRAMLSYFTRDVILDNTDYLKFVLMDEPLTTVSAENSVEISNFLKVLANRKQIILIEQKKEVFAAMDDIKTYFFKKTEGKTQITLL